MQLRPALKKLLATDKRLSVAYLLKASFGQLWSYQSEIWARAFFDCCAGGCDKRVGGALQVSTREHNGGVRGERHDHRAKPTDVSCAAATFATWWYAADAPSMSDAAGSAKPTYAAAAPRTPVVLSLT